MRKIYFFVAIASLSLLSARAEVTVKTSNMNEDCQLMGEAMSPNGKYVVGSNFATFAPCVWDVETNTYYDYICDGESASFHASSNNGLFVGDDGTQAAFATAGSELQNLWYNVGEEVYDEEFDFWYSTGDAGSSAYAVTADGETIFGFYYDATYYTTPCYWRNGERVDLPIPTDEEVGFEVSGAEVRWCSSDGKLLLGYVLDNYGTWPACVWRQNEQGGYDCDPICKDYYEADFGNNKPYMLFCPYGLSENGEWVSLSIQGEFDAFNWADPTPVQMARLNLKSGELQVLEEELDQTTIASCIANDGSMFFIRGALMGMIGRVASYWEAGAETSCPMEELTGEIEELEYALCNTPCYISGDGKTIQGFGMTDESDLFSYIISLSSVVNLNAVAAQQGKAFKICNLQGEKLDKVSTPGLYVVNGKKVLVK